MDPKKIGWNVVCGTREALTEMYNVFQKYPDSIKDEDDQAAYEFCLIVKDQINKSVHQERLQTSGERKQVEEAIHSVADAMFGKSDKLPLKSLHHVKWLVSNSLASTSGKKRKREFSGKKDAHGRLLKAFQNMKYEYRNLEDKYYSQEDRLRNLEHEFRNLEAKCYNQRDEIRYLRETNDNLYYHMGERFHSRNQN